MKDLLESGDYARKQIYCRSGLVRWSHGSRFEVARALVAPRAGGRLLDYGCGDGTFVAMVHAGFAESLGLDVDPKQLAECDARLGHLPGVSFALTPPVSGSQLSADGSQLSADGSQPDGSQLSADGSRLPASDSAPRVPRPASRAPRPAPRVWDVVTCMEVLEHCVEEERRRVIAELARLVSPSGMIVVSVPIEIGPTLAGKHLVRMIAGLRGLGDYKYRERYSPVEMLRGLAGARVPRVAIEGRGPDGPYRYYGHKGFDYRDVARELSEHFSVRRRLFSPMRLLGPVLNSQAWFVCVPR